MLGLFHDRYFFGWPTGLDVPLNGHKAVHDSTAVGNTEIGQPISRITHPHAFIRSNDISVLLSNETFRSLCRDAVAGADISHLIFYRQ